MKSNLNNNNDKRNLSPELYTQNETTKQLVCSYTKLLEAEQRCHRKVGYKNSVSRFDLNLLTRVLDLRKDLVNETYTTGQGQIFEIFEPKYRQVTSTKFRDRIPQASFVINYFYPTIISKHIPNNCACTKNKGIEFARSSFIKILKNSKLTDFCLKVDFKDYFASIDHEILFKELSPYMNQKWVSDYYKDVINSNKQDIGIGLGSEINQLSGVSLLDTLDKRLKDYRYIRYMDDIIFIGTKEECIQALKITYEEAERLHITISKNKTYIQKLTKPVKFLGFTYLLHNTGKVTLKRLSLKLNNEKRKLRAMKNKHVPFKRVREHYISVRSTMKKGNRSGVVKLDRYFNNLFKEEIQK